MTRLRRVTNPATIITFVVAISWLFLQVSGQKALDSTESIVLAEWSYGWPCRFAAREKLCFAPNSITDFESHPFSEDWTGTADSSIHRMATATPVSDLGNNKTTVIVQTGAWLFQSGECRHFSFVAMLVNLLVGITLIAGFYIACQSDAKLWRWQYSLRTMLTIVTVITIMLSTTPVAAWSKIVEVAALLVTIGAIAYIGIVFPAAKLGARVTHPLSLDA